VLLDSGNNVERAIRERQGGHRTLVDARQPDVDLLGVRLSRDCDAGRELLQRPSASAADIKDGCVSGHRHLP
jgi:hypothetical protein